MQYFKSIKDCENTLHTHLSYLHAFHRRRLFRQSFRHRVQYLRRYFLRDLHQDAQLKYEDDDHDVDDHWK